MSELRPCPHLPWPRPALNWRTLHVHREDIRGEEFYHDCLEYAHALWQRGLAARAILCLDRAFGAELCGGEEVLRQWPLPYGALAWFVKHTPPETFIGNLRVHFQHYAGRMNEPRREQRRWRAWACWALVRAILPDLAGDPKHPVGEPSYGLIARQLTMHGLRGEVYVWQNTINDQWV